MILETPNHPSCLVVCDAKSHNISITWSGEGRDAKCDRQESVVSLSFGDSHVEAPIQDKNRKKTSLWFVCDHSCGLLACGVGTKPSAATLELLLPDLHFSCPKTVSIDSNDPVSHRITPAPELHLSLKKWNKDRSLHTFKGNTIVCNIKNPSEEFGIFAEAQNRLRQLPIGYSQVFLPPESFHVTIMSLVNEGNYSSIIKRKPGKEGIKWEALHKSYQRKMARVLDRYKDTCVQMKVKNFEMKRHFGAIVEPANDRARQKLEKMYSDFARAAGFTLPNKRYPYHVSLAYGFLPVMPHQQSSIAEFIQQLENDLLPLEFEVLPPFFAVFNDMGAFTPL